MERIRSLVRKTHPPARHWLPSATAMTRSNYREEMEKRESKEKKDCVHNFVHNSHNILSKLGRQEGVTENHFHAHIHPGALLSNTHHQEGETSHWAEPQTPALSRGRTCSFSSKRGSRTTHNQEQFLFFKITLAENLYRARSFWRATTV